MSPPAKARSQAATRPAYDVQRVRQDFPGLRQEIHGKPLAYLDNAATAQKPRAVLEALRGFYEEDCANVHRGVHTLSMRATEKFEQARASVRRFLGAGDSKEIVFVRGATEAVNLVAQSYGRPRLGPGDEVLITWLEHHSNIVPWQLLCEQSGALLKVAPILDDGSVDMEAFEALLSERTRIVAAAHVSNALGTVLDVKRIVDSAHRAGAVVLLDGAQAAPHMPIDVRDLGCDFYAVSGHKMYGPTGIGALYGRRELLEEMPPYQGGGEMIRSVSFTGTSYNAVPHKFEAGTPHIAGAIGLGAAADYLESVDLGLAAAHEHAVLERATLGLSALDGVRLIGTAPGKTAVLSFLLDCAHAHDVGTVLDQEGVAVRGGHHCAQPVMERFGVAATSRASFGIYNTLDEADRLIAGVETVLEMFPRMTGLNDLYQEVILHHNRSPRNYGVLEGADHEALGHNPLCGDRLRLTLVMAGDRIEDIRFEGDGCAISRASASVMTDAVKGKSLEEAARLFRAFHALVTGAALPDDAPELDKLEVFSGVSEFPARVKCASLAWHTLQAAIKGDQALVTTE